jgi:hypothetical protein
MKSERAKWWMTAFGLFLALSGEIFYIVYDIPIIHSFLFKSSDRNTQEKPIAQLISQKNQVRFQPTGELYWDGVTDQQSFYKNESVLTLDQSKAEIAFLDGMGIIVEENSLIQLERNLSNSNDHQNITVKLLRGSIKKPKGVRKAVPSISVTIQAGDLIAKAPVESEFFLTSTPDLPGGAKIQVQEGEVLLESKKGPVTLKKGEESTFVPDQTHSSSPTVRQSAFFLIAPKGGETFHGTDSVTIEFSWKVNAVSTANAALELEASTSPDFTSHLHSVRIGVSTPPLEHIVRRVQLPVSSQSSPEGWYWRIKSIENSTILSDVSRFWIQSTQIIPKTTLLLRSSVPSQKPSSTPQVEEQKLPPPPEVFTPEIEAIPQGKGR